MADPNVLAAVERGNPVVFFDVSLGDQEAVVGRIKIVCPGLSQDGREFSTILYRRILEVRTANWIQELYLSPGH